MKYNNLLIAFIFLLLLFIPPVFAQSNQPSRSDSISEKIKPKVDHHQHLYSPSMAEFHKIEPIMAKDVIGLLDPAGIKRAVLLSTAFSYGKEGREPENEYEKVKEENDWNGAQAALYPKRLFAFCSFNPLKSYALNEISRCAKNPFLKRGIKLHFGNSDVQLENPQHFEKLKQVFQAANKNRMAIVVHMRASISQKRPYGPEQARLFLKLLSFAPDITVQVAHMAGSGPGFEDPPAHSVIEVLAKAVEENDPRTKNLWFDVTTLAHPEDTDENKTLLVKLIRQIGAKKILYGSDAAVGSNPNLLPRESWEAFCELPLTKKAVKKIANNVAPYIR